ncbi:hypothetical protein ACHAXN_001490, partial [Cyclotella atomus]
PSVVSLVVAVSNVSPVSSTRRPVVCSRSSSRTSSGTPSPTPSTLVVRLSPPWMLLRLEASRKDPLRIRRLSSSSSSLNLTECISLYYQAGFYKIHSSIKDPYHFILCFLSSNI